MRLKQGGLAIDAMSAFRQWHANDACLKTTQDLDTLVQLWFAFQPEIIPKAQRVAPNEELEGPSLIPKEKDAVVYCTCPSDKTSRAVLRRVLALQFFRVKFLKGGLAAWKAKGYPVESYQEVFTSTLQAWLRALGNLGRRGNPATDPTKSETCVGLAPS